jgi:BMFP domain-containing protein YqiC
MCGIELSPRWRIFRARAEIAALEKRIDELCEKHNNHVREFDEPRPAGWGGTHRYIRQRIDVGSSENAALRERVEKLEKRQALLDKWEFGLEENNKLVMILLKRVEKLEVRAESQHFLYKELADEFFIHKEYEKEAKAKKKGKRK